MKYRPFMLKFSTEFFFHVQAIYFEVQAIFCWSRGHLFVSSIQAIFLKYRPFILKYRPFIDVQAIFYWISGHLFKVQAFYVEVLYRPVFCSNKCQFILMYRPFIIEIQAIYNRSRGHKYYWSTGLFLLKNRPLFYWSTDHLLSKNRPFLIKVQADFYWSTYSLIHEHKNFSDFCFLQNFIFSSPKKNVCQGNYPSLHVEKNLSLYCTSVPQLKLVSKYHAMSLNHPDRDTI